MLTHALSAGMGPREYRGDNTMTATLSHRKELCFWGWGYTDEVLRPAEEEQMARLAAGREARRDAVDGCGHQTGTGARTGGI